MQVNSREQPNLVLPTQYTGIDKIYTNASLLANQIVKKIVEIAATIFKTAYLQNLNSKLEVKIYHIQSNLAYQSLPSNLQRYIIVRTTNLPSMKAIDSGVIQENCQNYFNKLKAQMLENIEKESNWRKKHIERVKDSFDHLQREIKDQENSDFEGVCHAMISQVASQFFQGKENFSLSIYASKYSHGVDEETAGLQRLMDKSRTVDWSRLQAIDSLTELTRTEIKPSEFNFIQQGIFHLGIPIHFGIKHSILLHINQEKAELLDPNFGVFSFPSTELKSFFCDYIKMYIKLTTGKEPTSDEMDQSISKSDHLLFENDEAAGELEIWQLEKAINYEWDLDYPNNVMKVIWKKPFKISFNHNLNS